MNENLNNSELNNLNQNEFNLEMNHGNNDLNQLNNNENDSNKKKNGKFIIIGLVLIVIVIVCLFFVFKKDSYVVEFDSDGGTIVTTQKITKGKNVYIPEEPKKENYIFVGWLYNGEPFDFSVPLEGNVTLTANWVAVEEGVTKYVVKFDSDGGTTFLNQIVDDGGFIVKPNNPVKTGYTFLEWTLNGVTYDFDSPVKSDIKLVACYDVANKPDTNENNGNESSEEIVDTSIVVPELTYDKHMAEILEDGVYLIDFFVESNKYNCKMLGDDQVCSVDGFEVYEKVGSNYKSLGLGVLGGAVPVNVEVGTKKVLVARVYALDKNKKKIYSGYSKEVVIDKTN